MIDDWDAPYTLKPNASLKAKDRLFCPNCKADVENAQGSYNQAEPLCAVCGERAETKGHCAVCERYWPLSPGQDCPKHDLPLDERAASMFHNPSGEPNPDWVTVRTFSDTMAATAPRIRLEAEGIPTFVAGERMGSVSMYRVAVGGVELQVPRHLLSEARILLDQIWSLEDDDPEGLDDAWDDLGETPRHWRLSMFEGVAMLFWIAPLLLVGCWALISLFRFG